MFFNLPTHKLCLKEAKMNVLEWYLNLWENDPLIALMLTAIIVGVLMIGFLWFLISFIRNENGARSSFIGSPNEGDGNEEEEDPNVLVVDKTYPVENTPWTHKTEVVLVETAEESSSNIGNLTIYLPSGVKPILIKRFSNSNDQVDLYSFVLTVNDNGQMISYPWISQNTEDGYTPHIKENIFGVYIIKVVEELAISANVS